MAINEGSNIDEGQNMGASVPCEALVRLDRKISKAVFTGKGVKLTGAELAILAQIRMVERIADAKAKALKEQIRLRQSELAPVGTYPVASASSRAAVSNHPVAPHGGDGTASQPNVSSGRARAWRTFG